MILERIPEIENLNQREKLTLVGELWDAIIQEEYPEITEEEKEILDRRYQHYKENPESGTPWHEVHNILKDQ